MVNRQIQFKICHFCTFFQIFVYDHGPGARASHIANDFFLQIRSPNKYIDKVDKRRFIKYKGFCVRHKNVLEGLWEPPLPWIGLILWPQLSDQQGILKKFCENWVDSHFFAFFVIKNSTLGFSLFQQFIWYLQTKTWFIAPRPITTTSRATEWIVLS